MRNPGINARVRKAVLGAIEREREGERIDQTLVRAVTSMLMDVGEDVYVQDSRSTSGFVDGVSGSSRSDSCGRVTPSIFGEANGVWMRNTRV